MEQWSIVEFDDGVQVVPNNWIKGELCYWPTFATNERFDRAVKRREEPHNDWPMYRASVLKTYGSYNQAKPKLKIAEEQTDVNSDCDEQTKGKRRRIQKKRHHYLSSDTEESTDEHTNSKIKPFPLPRRVLSTGISEFKNSNSFEKKKSKSGVIPNNTIHDEADGVEVVSNKVPEIPTTSTRKELLGSSYRISNENRDENSDNNDLSLLNNSSQFMPHQPTTSQDTYAILPDFKEKLFREISSIKLKINILQESFERFQNSGCNCRSNVPQEADKEEENILDDFPIESIEKLEEIERNIVSSKEYESKLINRLSLIGGYKVDQIVKLILIRVFTDEVASLFNWLGKKNKRVFSELRITKIILQSIRKNVNGKALLEKDIIDSIKNWLRHAKARNDNKKK